MPNKKNPTTLVTEDELVEAVSVRVTDQIRRDMDDRFGQMQQLIEKLASPSEDVQPVSDRTRKRLAEQDPDPQQAGNLASKRPRIGGIHDTSHSSIPDSDGGRAEFPLHDSYAAIQPARGAHAQPHPEAYLPSGANVNNNNNNPTWNTWLETQRRYNTYAPPSTARISHEQLPAALGRPTYEAGAYTGGDIEAQVRHIMDVTPHQLKGNIPPGVFPFKQVTRGPEKRKLSFNTVTLAEHIFGMFRILDDVHTNPAVKPDILMHMREVAEDACEFEWQGYVRRWSEEVFNLVAEGRLPRGWAETSRIQNLRTGMSRVDSARLTYPKEATNAKKSSAYGQSADHLRGGPPCQSFNSPQGCSQQSGHVSNGKKQIHVCSYCLVNNASAHPHSEAHCRNKQRHAASHFH